MRGTSVVLLACLSKQKPEPGLAGLRVLAFTAFVVATRPRGPPPAGACCPDLSGPRSTTNRPNPRVCLLSNRARILKFLLAFPVASFLFSCLIPTRSVTMPSDAQPSLEPTLAVQQRRAATRQYFYLTPGRMSAVTDATAPQPR